MTDTIPDVYADGARISFSAGGITLIFLRSAPTLTDDEPAGVEGVAFVRMSHSMANQVADLIKKSLDTLEEQLRGEGPVAHLVQSPMAQATVSTSRPSEPS